MKSRAVLAPLVPHPTACAMGVALALMAAQVLAQSVPEPLAGPAPQRLSRWLLEQPGQGAAFPLGLSLQVPEAQPAQLSLKLELLRELGRLQPSTPWGSRAAGLAERLSAMPVTGRVPVASGDARWLEVNPQRDPLLMPGHRVDLPPRPRSVSLLTPDGVQCRLDHVAGQEALAYVRACAGLNGEDVDWAWVAQPDGRVDRVGVASWNRAAQDAVAPGAWIWAPPRALRVPERFSGQLIRFLATQGPAPDEPARSPAAVESPVTGGPAAGLRWSAVAQELLVPETPAPPPQQPSAPVAALPDRGRDWMHTGNDWGMVGALQTPSARMRSAGHLAVSASRVEPYTRYNVIAQPFEWLEAGFRYTDVANRLYGPVDLSGDQSYKDKSFDAKFGLWPETALRPELALGFIDPAGTGLFSSEYLVASKRWGAFDFSAGLAWGYLAGRSRKQFITGQGGAFSFSQYFSGTPQPFGSVQWMTPWQGLVVKLEYDSNTYQNEPLGNRFVQRSRINSGLVYRYTPWLDLTLGFERGNQLMLGVSIHTDLSKVNAPKIFDAVPIPVSAQRPQGEPDWQRTARDLNTQTGWTVSSIHNGSRQLAVTVSNPETVYWQDRVDRAASVLHRDAPAAVDHFVLRYEARGQPQAEQVVDREAWVAAQTRPVPAGAESPSLVRDAQPAPPAPPQFQAISKAWKTESRLDYTQSAGGPDAFILYQLSAEQTAELKLFGRDDTWVMGKLRLSLLNNYDQFKYDAPSNLPRVRTDIRKYVTSSDLTIPYLQATHVRKVADNQYASVYAGYLETMYAGFGGEWLYRPFASRVALGVDANYVWQREFSQKFSMLKPGYETFTGHATLYWDTRWQGVQVKTSVGQYLAKDIGVTVDVSRRFRNGLVFGAFATKTNISAAEFGEGSFDKGLYLGIPFDAFMPRTVGGYFSTGWKPLYRDGGAKLDRQVSLYGLTTARDLQSYETRPAPLPNVLPVDREPVWQPPREIAALTAAAAVPVPVPDAAWRAEAGPTLRLVQALDREGFRNARVEYDGAHRLNLRLAHERLKPLSRAMGLAARTALAYAPAGVRELRIQLAEHNDPLVEYDFFDLARLRAFFAGEITVASLQPAVAVRYLHAGAREADPLARLGDTAAVPAAPSLLEAVPGAVLQEPRRVLDDVAGAAKSLGRVDWLNAAGIGLLAVGGSSLLDSRAQQFARDHAAAGWLKSLNRVGDALPWVGLAGAGLLALDGSDPRRARTALSAAESGVTAAVAATGLKYVFGRPRPNSGFSRNDFSPGDGNRDSMPSRHAAVAWAVATPFAEEYRAPWIYGLAAITNLSRVGKQQHWFSDTVAGSLLGYGVGRLFWESGRGNQQMPQVFVDPSGVNMHWSFR